MRGDPPSPPHAFFLVRADALAGHRHGVPPRANRLSGPDLWSRPTWAMSPASPRFPNASRIASGRSGGTGAETSSLMSVAGHASGLRVGT